jgi:cytochrome P450
LGESIVVMNLPILNLVLLALLYFPIRLFFRFRANLKAARASGLPYICSPVHVFDTPWIAASQLVLPLLRKIIPARWQGLVLDLMDPEWSWKRGYIPFKGGAKGMGTDTFLVVAPTATSLMTADPSVINQITTRRNDFPKPIYLYEGIDIYGKNVVTTEGPVWRRHRKSTIPPFGEKNNRLVWSESIFQAEQMIYHWKVTSEKTNKSKSEKPSKSLSSLISELGHDTMRLSLYVISRAGFDVRCDWPESSGDTAKEGVMSSTYVPKGFELSYVNSLESLLHRLIALIMLPTWFLKYAPFQFLRTANTAFVEWGKYMTDIYNKKKTEILESKRPEDESMDIMGAMIRTSGQIPGTANYGKKDAGLTQDEILGNSFVLFLAGHETAANTIHFSMLYLAIKPEIQRKLQGLFHYLNSLLKANIT